MNSNPNAGILIEGFNQLTKQQAFDMAARHILSTRQPGISGGGNCTYQGTGCAASCFLTPKAREYVAGSWSTVASMTGERHLVKFIKALQWAHDFTYNCMTEDTKRDVIDTSLWFKRWVAAMHNIAFAADLDSSVLNGL